MSSNDRMLKERGMVSWVEYVRSEMLNFIDPSHVGVMGQSIGGVIPILKQYEKDGILNRTARINIAALQKLEDGGYSKDYGLSDTDRLLIRKNGVTAEVFANEVERLTGKQGTS